MNAKKNVLGRGLGALIEDAGLPKEMIQAIEPTNEIDINLIDPNPFQPRKDFKEEELEELAESIKHLGIVQPLTLRKQDNGRYQIIAGERRFRAAKIAGLTTVPAFIITTNDQGMLELALVENIQRTDLNPIEIAISYQRLIDECSLTQELLSERVGKKRATVANYLRLLKLPAEIQLAIREEKISMGHAKALLSIDDEKKLLKIFKKVVDQQLSVRAIEELVKEANEETEEAAAGKKKVDNTSSEYEELRQQLSNFFKAKVTFQRKSTGEGKIIIPFKNDTELEKILSVLDTKTN